MPFFLYGNRSTPNPVPMGLKELSLNAWDANCNLFNKIGFVTKYYGKEGGLGTFEARLKPMLEASQKLKKEFPEYGEISTKKNGMTEFRLKKILARTGSEDLDIVNTKKSKTNKKKSKSDKNRTVKKRWIVFNYLINGLKEFPS